MTTLLRLRDSNTIEQPYTVAQFRQDRPDLSISNNPHAGELASYAALDVPVLVVWAADVVPPEIDARTQRLLPVEFEKVDGAWRQVWSVRDATPAEIEEYDAANQPLPPPPDWTTYREGLRDQRYVEVVAAALSSTPEAKYGAAIISSALNSFQDRGDYRDYLDCIVWILGGSSLPAAEKTELAAELLALITRCNLPGAFITELIEALDSLSSP